MADKLTVAARAPRVQEGQTLADYLGTCGVTVIGTAQTVVCDGCSRVLTAPTVELLGDLARELGWRIAAPGDERGLDLCGYCE